MSVSCQACGKSIKKGKSYDCEKCGSNPCCDSDCFKQTESKGHRYCRILHGNIRGGQLDVSAIIRGLEKDQCLMLIVSEDASFVCTKLLDMTLTGSEDDYEPVVMFVINLIIDGSLILEDESIEDTDHIEVTASYNNAKDRALFKINCPKAKLVLNERSVNDAKRRGVTIVGQ